MVMVMVMVCRRLHRLHRGEGRTVGEGVVAELIAHKRTEKIDEENLNGGDATKE